LKEPTEGLLRTQPQCFPARQHQIKTNTILGLNLIPSSKGIRMTAATMKVSPLTKRADRALIQRQERLGQAYTDFFMVENQLRVGMHNLLVEKKGSGYSLSTIFPKFKYHSGDSEQEIDIGAKLSKRKARERLHNLIAGLEFPDFWYLDFPILCALLDSFWQQYFKDLFISDSDVHVELVSRMRLLFAIRNSIAHNRYINKHDLDEIEAFDTILKSFMKSDLLSNFDDLAFTKPEGLRAAIEASLESLLLEIDRGRVILPAKIHDVSSLLAALAQVVSNAKELVKIYDALAQTLYEYNDTLPRKPGRGYVVARFVSENNLKARIQALINKTRTI
jgi:hypothetical protein